MRRSPELQCESGQPALGSSRPRLRTPASAGHPSQSSSGRDTFLAFGVDWLVSRSCWRCHRRHCRRRAAHESIALRPTDQPSGRSRTKFEDPLHEIVWVVFTSPFVFASLRARGRVQHWPRLGSGATSYLLRPPPKRFHRCCAAVVNGLTGTRRRAGPVSLIPARAPVNVVVTN